jgi:hypothetical protein
MDDREMAYRASVVRLTVEPLMLDEMPSRHDEL